MKSRFGRVAPRIAAALLLLVATSTLSGCYFGGYRHHRYHHGYRR
jgi:hypothetical protein